MSQDPSSDHGGTSHEEPDESDACQEESIVSGRLVFAIIACVVMFALIAFKFFSVEITCSVNRTGTSEEDRPSIVDAGASL